MVCFNFKTNISVKIYGKFNQFNLTHNKMCSSMNMISV